MAQIEPKAWNAHWGVCCKPKVEVHQCSTTCHAQFDLHLLLFQLTQWKKCFQMKKGWTMDFLHDVEPLSVHHVWVMVGRHILEKMVIQEDLRLPTQNWQAWNFKTHRCFRVLRLSVSITVPNLAWFWFRGIHSSSSSTVKAWLTLRNVSQGTKMESGETLHALESEVIGNCSLIFVAQQGLPSLWSSSSYART